MNVEDFAPIDGTNWVIEYQTSLGGTPQTVFYAVVAGGFTPPSSVSNQCACGAFTDYFGFAACGIGTGGTATITHS